MKDREMVKATDVWKRFGDIEVLKGISLTVKEGEVLCLIGRSGSGKTTFLRCINHLEKFDSGRIWVGGELIGYHDVNGRLHELTDHAVCAQRARIGMVFQRFNLFPHMTALENVMVGPRKVKGQRRVEIAPRARQLLERVGLGNRADAYPVQLSGGQQQRVAIARALAMDPELMLFDEPTSALDPELVGEVLDVMKTLANEGMTMVVVTHEMSFARDVADTIAYLDTGEVAEIGPAVEVLNNPKSELTKRFLAHVK